VIIAADYPLLDIFWATLAETDRAKRLLDERAITPVELETLKAKALA